MKVNFITDLKNDRGTLVFLCFKNKPLDKYLNNLNKKFKGYIDKAIKISGMQYNNNSFVDLIIPPGTNSDRIILFGLEKNKLISEYDFGKLGSYITSVLNNKKIKDIKLISSDFGKNITNEVNILYGMALNTYRFNKYFTDGKNKRNNYFENLTMISKNSNHVKKLWNRYNAIKEGVFD